MCSFFAIHRQKYARNSGAKLDGPLKRGRTNTHDAERCCRPKSAVIRIRILGHAWYFVYQLS